MKKSKEQPKRVYEIINIYPEMSDEEREQGRKEAALDIARILLRAKQEGKLNVAT